MNSPPKIPKEFSQPPKIKDSHDSTITPSFAPIITTLVEYAIADVVISPPLDAIIDELFELQISTPLYEQTEIILDAIESNI